MSVQINFASFGELQTIPGVGASIASVIMSIREKSGNITPDILIALTRGRVSQKAIDDIDFTPNDELPDEIDEYGCFSSRASTVKREPSSEKWGSAAALFNSARGKLRQLGSPVPERKKFSFKRSLSPVNNTGLANSQGASGEESPSIPSPVQTPGVTTGDLDNVVELLRKAKDIMSSSPALHSKLAELDLPPLPNVPTNPVSASAMHRPVNAEGATSPTRKAMAPLRDSGNFVGGAEVPEKRKLSFTDSLAAHEDKSEDSSTHEGGGGSQR